MSANPPPPGYPGDQPGSFTPGAPPPPAAPPQADALRLVKPPAIALMVFAGLNALQGLLFLGVGLFGAAEPSVWSGGQASDLDPAANAAIAVVLALLMMGTGGFVFFGAMKMMKLQSWGLALAATIIAMVPCFTVYCCPLGLGFGIWALVILVKPEVKAAFS